MKNLISYIQEKYLIDIDIDVNKCDNIDDLLSIYKLKEIKSNSNDSKSFSRIILKCPKDVFNIYINFFNNFEKNYKDTNNKFTREINKFTSKEYPIIIVTKLSDTNNNGWHDVILSQKNDITNKIEILFNINDPIIKIYFRPNNKDIIDNAAKTINYILSK